MPTYTYKCLLCEKEKEEYHSITEYDSRKNPWCCNQTMKTILSFINNKAPAVIFRGSGWPSKDFKRK